MTAATATPPHWRNRYLSTSVDPVRSCARRSNVDSVSVTRADRPNGALHLRQVVLRSIGHAVEGCISSRAPQRTTRSPVRAVRASHVSREVIVIDPGPRLVALDDEHLKTGCVDD